MISLEDAQILKDNHVGIGAANSGTPGSALLSAPSNILFRPDEEVKKEEVDD